MRNDKMNSNFNFNPTTNWIIEIVENQTKNTHIEMSIKVINQRLFDKRVKDLLLNKSLCINSEIGLSNFKKLDYIQDKILKYGTNYQNVRWDKQSIGICKNLQKNTSYRHTYRKNNDGKFQYVEGIIVSKTNPFHVIPHSWLINEKGEHIDCFVKNPQDFDYFGIIIPKDIVKKVVTDQNFNYLSVLPFIEIEYLREIHYRLKKGTGKMR